MNTTTETTYYDNGISLDSYLVGYLHHALNDISDCLVANDSNKAMRITHAVIKYLKDNLHFNQTERNVSETPLANEQENQFPTEY